MPDVDTSASTRDRDTDPALLALLGQRAITARAAALSLAVTADAVRRAGRPSGNSSADNLALASRAYRPLRPAFGARGPSAGFDVVAELNADIADIDVFNVFVEGEAVDVADSDVDVVLILNAVELIEDAGSQR